MDRQLSTSQVVVRRLLLYAVCVAFAAAEAAPLYASGFVSAVPLAPQVAAPAPFGAYHDLRWVFTFSASWYSVAWQLAALLGFRTGLSALLTVLAWPDDVAPPRLVPLLARNAVGTLISVVVLSPWAALAFASSALSYSWFMLGSVIAMAATAVVTPVVAVNGAWWRRIIPWRAMLFNLVIWVALMVEALAISYAPGWVAVPTAAASGALNALLWQHQVITVVHAPVEHRRIPLAPVGLLAVLALFLVGGGYLVGSGSLTSTKQPLASTVAPLPADVALLYVAGYGSAYDGHRFVLLGTRAWHFSYRGVASGRPEPYRPRATHQPLAVSAQRLAAQVGVVHRRSGARVVLLADSEGTLVVRTYLETHPRPPVRMFIETSPLLRPGRVYFPAAGRDGYGIAGGWEAREVLALIDLENPGFAKTADEPFVRSVVDNAGDLRGRTMCPAGRVAVFALVPFAGALTVYDQPVSHIAWTALPGYHATLLHDADAQRSIATLIRTGRLPRHSTSTGAFDVISAAAAAWQAPALPLALRTGWRSGDHRDAAFTQWRCPTGT